MLAGAGSGGMAGLPGKQWGSSRSARKAPVFYGLVALGTVGGTALSLPHVNPIKLLVVVAVINGAAAPFRIVVMRVASSPHIMGGYVNGNAANILGWLTAALMAAAAIACSPAEDSASDRPASCWQSRKGCRPACGHAGCTG